MLSNAFVLNFGISLAVSKSSEDHGSLSFAPRPPEAARAPRLVFSTAPSRQSLKKESHDPHQSFLQLK
jgi:hypothetical protein